MRATVFIAIAALAGCNATMPTTTARPTSKDDPTVYCLAAMASNTALAPLAAKIPLGNPGRASLEMLSSQERPTDDEKLALSRWASLRMSCLDDGREFRAKYAPPGWSAVLEQGQYELIQTISRLYNGTMTYGEFNTQRQQLAVRLAANLDAAARNADAADAARRAQANADLTQTMQLLQAMQPRPIPIPTPSPSVICTSRPSPGGATTVCQ